MNAEEYLRYVAGVKNHGRTRYAEIVLEELEQKLRNDKTLRVVHEHVHRHEHTVTLNGTPQHQALEDIVDADVIEEDAPQELEQ